MTWVNSDEDYFPGADRGWAFGWGAGGSCIMWNRRFGIAFAGFGVDTTVTTKGVPHVIEANLTGVRTR